MKKLGTTIIFTLMAFFTVTMSALANANQAHTCDSANKVIRDYKSNPQAWKNRQLYTESRKATQYFEAHCSGSHSGGLINANLNTQQTGQIRPATCKDCYDAGYRKGIQAGQLAAQNASSVTHPSAYQNTAALPARAVYVSQQAKMPMDKHVGHNHHSEAERLDCELTDALNRQAGPVTTVIKRVLNPVPFSKVQRIAKKPMIKHGDHTHHSEVEKADCALTDALNRRAGPVVTAIKNIH